jgi:hypothetical protein
MERKPRRGRGTRVPRRPSERASQPTREVDWPMANESWVAMAGGYTRVDGERRYQWRVGIYASEDGTPRARIPVEAAQALQLARALVAVAGSVEHLNEFHPDGDRGTCRHPSVVRLMKPDGGLTTGEVDKLLDEAFGPLGDALQRAASLTEEVRGMVNALYTIALEHGLFAPAGTVVAIDRSAHEHVTERVGKFLGCLSEEAKALLVMTLYLSGDKMLAEVFGLPEHSPGTPSNTTTH